MSREIDERVVQMKFEKGQFEKDIQTSIHNLDELKKGLDFKSATKGFEELDKSARNVDISALGKAIDQVHLKFGMLDVLALNVMNRISDAILNAANSAKRLVTELTIDQITPGWDKYAQKTSSVQTIMAATAAQFSDTAVQMEVVNAQLDKLNWFTDETSYNFVDMVNNIGKFTSNNIALDQSVTAMQGIANWAAISGANAQEASRAMYNLAQALATGTVKLIDWKSIENANMATTEFKQTVIDIATELGTLKKVGEDAWTTIDGKQAVSVSNFNEGLSKGWFTNDVLMRALNKYGAAAEKLNEIYDTLGSEVTTSRIVSSVEKYTNALNNARSEAKELGLDVEATNKKVASAGKQVAKEVADSWGVSLDEATEMLAAFDDETMQFGLKAFKAAQEAKTFQEAIDSVKDAVSTGWMKTFELLFGSYTEAKELWTNLANTLYDIFASSGDARNEMLSEWSEKGGRKYFTDMIYASLAAILSILNPIKAGWDAVFGRMTADSLLDITKRLHSFVLSLVQSKESMQKLARVFRGLFSILDIAKMTITRVVKGGFDVLRRVLAELNIDAGEFAASLGDGLFQIRNWVKETDFIAGIFEKIGDALVWAIKKAREFIDKIKEFGPVKALIDGLNSTFTGEFKGIGGVLEAVGNILSWLWNKFKAFKLPTNLNDILEFFKQFGEEVFNDFQSIGIDLTWLKDLFSNFSDSVKSALQSVNQAFIASTDVVGGALGYLIAVFKSVDWSGVILAAFGVSTLALLWKFADAINGIAKAFQNVTGVGKSAQGALNAIRDYFKALKANVQANALLKIAISITALAVSLGLLAKFKWDELKDGAKTLGIIGVSLIVVAGAMAILSKIGMNVSGLSTLLMSFAGSIAILVFALNQIPNDIQSLNNKLWAVLDLAGIIVLAMTALSVITKATPIKASNFVALAASIYLLVIAMKSIGEQDLMSLYAATPVIIALMGALAALSRLLTYTKVIEKNYGHNVKTTSKMGGTFGTTIGLAMGIILLIQAVKMLGNMDPATVTQGVILCIPIMIALVTLFKASAKAGQYASSAGKMMLFLAAGLAILIPVVKGFAAMDIGELVKGGLTITALSTLIMLPLVALSKFAGKYAAKAGLMILEIAGALALIQLVVKTLGKIDFVTLAKGTAAVAVLIVAFSTVLSALHGLGKASEQNVKAMTQVVIIVGILSALVLLLTAINPLGALAVSAGLAALFAGIAVMLKQIDGIRLPDEKKLVVMLSCIAAIGAIIGIMGYLTDWKGALAVSVGMTAIMLALASVSQIVKNSATTDAMLGKLIILRRFAFYMAAVVAALAGVAWLFQQSGGTATQLLAVTTAFSEIVLAIGLTGKMIGKLSLPETRKLNQVAIFAAEMAGIVAALGLLVGLASKNDFDISQLLMVTTAMSEIMLAMGVAIRLISTTKIDDGATGQIIAMGIVVTIMGSVLGIIASVVSSSGMDMTDMIIFATGISEIAIAMGIAARIMGKTDFSLGIVSATAMGIMVAAIGATLGYFSSMTDPNRVLPLALGMSVVLLAVSAAAVILSRFPADPNAFIGATMGIGIVLIIIAGMAAIMAAIGALVTDTSVFDKAGDAFIKIGRAIGGFFGGILGGFAEGVTSSFPGICQNISDGMTNLQSFFDGLENMPENVVELCWALVGVVGAMTAAEFISGLESLPIIGGLIKSGSENLKENFTTFGEAIRAFSDSLGTGFNGYNVKLAAEAISILATTEKDMSSFKTFVDTLNGQAGDLGQFGTRLTQLGNGLKQFSLATDGISNDTISNATTVTKTLIELEKGLPKKDGALQQFFGSVDIGEFGNRLFNFGIYLRLFATQVNGITKESVSGAASAGESLVKLENLLGPYGGKVSGFLFGDRDLGAFGGRLVIFAQAMVDFSNKIGELGNLVNINNGVIAANRLIELEKDIEEEGGLKTLWSNDGNFSSFGKNLGALADALLTFSIRANQLNIPRLQEVINWIKDIIALQNLDFVESDVIKAVSNIVSDIQNTIERNYTGMKNSGTTLMYWVARGVEDGSSKYSYIVQRAAVTMGDQFIEAFEVALGIASPSVVMQEEGVWVVKGLAEGITKETSAEEAAKKKAQNLVSAFESELSKLTSKEKTSSLEFQLWQLTDGKGASEVEIAKKQLELENEKLADLARTVSAKKVIMESIAQISGESSAEYQSAYQDYLQAQIDMLNQQKSVEDTYYSSNSALSTDARDQAVAFANFMRDNAQVYEFLGKSQQELEDAAYKAAYGLDAEAVARKRQYEQTLAEYAESFEFMGKTRDELETFAREQSGWTNITDSVNQTMSDTAQIIKDNIDYYSLDLGATLDMAMAEVIANSAKGGSKSSGAAAGAGQGLGETMLDNIKKAVTGGGDIEDGETIQNGMLALFNQTDIWTNISDFFSDKSSGLSAVFSSSFIDGLTDKTQPIADAISELMQNGLGDSLDSVKELVTTYGKDAILGLAEGIKDEEQKTQLIDAVNGSMIDPVKTTIEEGLDTHSPSKVTQEYGANATEGFAIGIAESEKIAMVKEAIGGVLSIIEETKDKMPSLGLDTMKNYADGLSNKEIIDRISQIAASIAENTTAPFVNLAPTMKTLGINAMQGLTNGINEEGAKAIQAAQAVAQSVAAAMAAALKVKSPSRVTTEIGRFVGIGLANGISETTSNVQSSVETMANNTISSLEYAADAIGTILSSDEDFQPVITPVLDMDELKKQADTIPGLLSSDRSISLNSTRLRVGQISAGKEESTSQNGSNAPNQTNYNFVQNNYSPKALNRLEIYRQTNNQFSRIKEATKR